MTSPTPERSISEAPTYEDADLTALRGGVRILALRALGDAMLADDVAQETVARVLTALQQGRVAGPGNLGAFARGVARHVIGDLGRRAGRERADDGVIAIARDPAADPLQRLVQREERDRLSAALAELSQADRELLRLCFVEGLTPDEIARRERAPAERIRKRKSRALARLRAAFLGHDATATTTEHREQSGS